MNAHARHRSECTVAAAALVLCAPMVAQAAAGSLPPDLAQAAAAFDRAQIMGDKAALNRLLADDYRLVNSRAEVETKTQFVAEFSDPSFKLAPFKVIEPVERVWRDGAVLAGQVRLSGMSAGKPFSARVRFVDVWARARRAMESSVYRGDAGSCKQTLA